MSKQELPYEWQWKKLHNICEMDRNGIQPSSKEAENLPYLSLEHVESDSGQILLNELNNIDDVQSMTYFFDTRHVLYGKLRPYLNKVAVPNFEGRCTTELIPLLPINTDRRFLAWLLRRQESVDEAMQGKTGSRMPRTKMTDFMKMKIPLPPLAEQKRIAAIIDEQMQEVETARQAILAELEAAEAMSAAYLREVFRKYDLGEYKQFEELIADGPTNGLYKTSDFIGDEGILYINITGIYSDGFIVEPSGSRRLQVSEDELNRYELLSGDIIVNRVYGSPDKVGRAVLVDGLTEQAVYESNMMRIRVNQDLVLPLFIVYYMASNDSREELLSMANINNQASVNQTAVKSLHIPFLPIATQQQVVNEIDELHQEAEILVSNLLKKLKAIEAMPAAILRRAFSGGYREEKLSK